MPHLNSSRVQHRIAELGLTVKQLSERCEINYGSLRNAVFGHDPISLLRAYRILDALNPPGRAHLLIDDILGEETKPAEPPKQPAGPKSPPRRQDHEPGKTGPKRVTKSAAA